MEEAEDPVYLLEELKQLTTPGVMIDTNVENNNFAIKEIPKSADRVNYYSSYRLNSLAKMMSSLLHKIWIKDRTSQRARKENIVATDRVIRTPPTRLKNRRQRVRKRSVGAAMNTDYEEWNVITVLMHLTTFLILLIILITCWYTSIVYPKEVDGFVRCFVVCALFVILLRKFKAAR